jgi:hypothetical protein
MMRRRHGEPRRRESGAALLYVLFLLVLCTTAGALIATSLAIDARTRREDARRLRLAPLVDSAVVEAIGALAVDPHAAGFPPHAFGGGEIESEITSLAESTREVRARASWGGVRRGVVARVFLAESGPIVVAWMPESRAPGP